MRNSVFKAPSGALVSARLLPLWREGVCVAQACPPPPLAVSPAWLPAQPAAHPDLPPRPGVSSLAGGSARLSPSLRCHHGDHLPLPLPADPRQSHHTLRPRGSLLSRAQVSLTFETVLDSQERGTPTGAPQHRPTGAAGRRAHGACGARLTAGRLDMGRSVLAMAPGSCAGRAAGPP
ncbi:Hypothetical predicted protein, partial [Marmota monax]